MCAFVSFEEEENVLQQAYKVWDYERLWRSDEECDGESEPLDGEEQPKNQLWKRKEQGEAQAKAISK